MVVNDESMRGLCGDRVELFQLRTSDVTGDYLRWLSNRDVTQYLEVRFSRPERDDLVAFVEQCLSSPSTVLLGIREREQGRHVGNIKLSWSVNHQVGDVGIMLGDREHWGRGFASQSVRLVTALAFHTLGLRKLVAGIYRSNQSSVRTFHSAGFAQEAELRGHALLDGHPEDVLLFSAFPSPATRAATS